MIAEDDVGGEKLKECIGQISGDDIKSDSE